MDKYKHTDDKSNILHELESGYEKAEMDLLRNALRRNFNERFLVMTRLMRRGIMLKNAKIIKRPPLNS